MVTHPPFFITWPANRDPRITIVCSWYGDVVGLFNVYWMFVLHHPLRENIFKTKPVCVIKKIGDPCSNVQPTLLLIGVLLLSSCAVVLVCWLRTVILVHAQSCSSKLISWSTFKEQPALDSETGLNTQFWAWLPINNVTRAVSNAPRHTNISKTGYNSSYPKLYYWCV